MADLKTYPISDLRIRVEVQDRLWHAHGLDTADVTVKVERGEVRLTGVVWSSDAFRRAEHVAGAVEGVRRIRNQLQVRTRPTAAVAGLEL
ncbi:BON domain-containing protein [Phenylobacterium sp. J367]|uniref:BON domain-containing protein n=1 Tax=Phenylobacterium sp. J367 TaxID=2898435 RepID=UPI002150D327|nr:BON domain-containing protein [Phenylobacterium sp. J367]MCR5877205.1 BON domain-containing protein [Phenylobacterium sp. J367]